MINKQESGSEEEGYRNILILIDFFYKSLNIY